MKAIRFPSGDQRGIAASNRFVSEFFQSFCTSANDTLLPCSWFVTHWRHITYQPQTLAEWGLGSSFSAVLPLHRSEFAKVILGPIN